CPPRPVAHASPAERRAARIALPAVTRVGYVRGASDRVPEALQSVGVPLELLGPDTLARGDLSRYDAIVIGSRAYEVDAALVASNGRLLDYARTGGLVIVQYQQYPFVNGNFAPYRLSIARPHDRVTDETAPVTERDAAHRVFHVPNEIGPDDWAGWVQERGLYFAHDWDAAYTPLLETHDPGEPPLFGGLLVAAVGQGTYVYTGLSFFRQLPAGVPGAYRLFANLQPPRSGSAHPARASLRAAASRGRCALARHGLAGGVRPAALGARQPPGRRVVRRSCGDLRPRGARFAARAVSAQLGGRHR